MQVEVNEDMSSKNKRTKSAETNGRELHSRHDQTFPSLSAAEIERVRRFAEVRHYRDGEVLIETGKPWDALHLSRIR